MHSPSYNTIDGYLKMKKNNYHILYVCNGSPKVKTVSSKEEARIFVTQIVSQDKFSQNHVRWVSGIVIGEYHEAELDYKEDKLLKILT